MPIKKSITSLSFDIRAIAEKASQTPNCIRADIGEPNYAPPTKFREICAELIKTEDFAYAPTFGDPELLVELSKFEAKKFQNFKDPQFCVTSGAQAGLFAIFTSILGENDEILVHKAYYPPYKSIAQILGAKLITVDFEDSVAVSSKISAKTKIILVNSPNNPTGEIFSAAVLQNLARISRENNLVVISDDVYDRLIFEENKLSHIANFYPEKTIIVNSISKTFCLTGARIGWILGEKNLISQITKVHRNMNSCPNSLMQKALAKYLPVSQDFLENMRQEFENRGQKMAKIFNDLGWKCASPQGAMYLMPQIPNLIDSKKFVLEELIAKKGISGIPGEFFGKQNKDKIRFCFGALNQKQIAEFSKKIKN